MLDQRFYKAGWAPTATEMAGYVSGSVARGDPGVVVQSVAAAGHSGPADLTFIESPDFAPVVVAGVCITTPDLTEALPEGVTIIAARRPRAAFARAAVRIAAPRELEPGQPCVHPSARIHENAIVEPGCIIGADVAVGPDTRIGAGSVLGPGVQIGCGGRVGANCTIRCSLIGDGVAILSGAVIGETGFGLAAGEGGPALSPHFGRVIVQDSVSIGANSCVDRGVFGDTVIGAGTHIDNLCHIGHNSRIGLNVVMAAFAGVSGSVEIGDNVQFGGRVGVKDHIRIGRNARVAAGAAVLKDVGDGETHAGYPAKPFRTWMRELAWLASAAQNRSKESGQG